MTDFDSRMTGNELVGAGLILGGFILLIAVAWVAAALRDRRRGRAFLAAHAAGRFVGLATATGRGNGIVALRPRLFSFGIGVLVGALAFVLAGQAVRAPELEKLRSHRAGAIALTEKKCLQPLHYLVKPRNVSVLDRPRLAEIAKGDHVQRMYAGDHCNDVEWVIRLVFGPDAEDALGVAWCESRYSIWATNGQYQNIFQMGSSERRQYGWHVAGSPAIVAARAAHRMFNASGESWGRWQCLPNGGLRW